MMLEFFLRSVVEWLVTALERRWALALTEHDDLALEPNPSHVGSAA